MTDACTYRPVTVRTYSPTRPDAISYLQQAQPLATPREEDTMTTYREVPTDPHVLAAMLEHVAEDHAAPEDVGPTTPDTAVIEVERVAVRIGGTFAYLTRRVIRSAPRPGNHS